MSRKITGRRAAYTLTELLIVIMIALLLMVVSLPMVKSVMDDARPREASRILNTTIVTAKGRAAASGTLAGIEFALQVIGDPNASPAAYQCTQMVMVEVPALYAGDASTSHATIDVSTANPVSGTNPQQNTYRLYLQDYPITNIGMGQPAPDNTTNTAYWLTDQKQIANDARNAGDEDVFEIRFNFRGGWYPAKRSTTTNQFTIQFAGNPPVHASSNPNSPAVYRSCPFQIRRPPVRVGNPVELPKGTAIDMTYSGTGPLGVQFRDTAALRVMFTPEGSVYSFSRIDKVTVQGSGVRNQPVDYPVFGTVHFLVGLSSKINPMREGMSGPFYYNDPTKSNLADANALWVSIGRGSGVVTTNENAPDLSPAALTDPSDVMQQAAWFSNCRRYATSREQKGGR